MLSTASGCYCDWLHKAQWLVWHGKGRQAVARIKGIDEELLARPEHEDSTLWWNLRRLYFYIDNNDSTLVNYGARYRRACRSAAASRSRQSTCWWVTEWPRSSRCAGPTKGHTISFRLVWLR